MARRPTVHPRRTRAFLAAITLAVGAGCADENPLPDDATPPPAAWAQEPGSDSTPAAGAADTEVSVFFTRNEQPVSVTRRVPATVAVLNAALDALLAGPTDAERARGISSWFSAETAGMLLAATIDADGHATVDFADFSAIIPSASASAGSTVLFGELNATVFQFDAIRSVEYRFEGDCTRFFEWLQRSCETIMRPG